MPSKVKFQNIEKDDITGCGAITSRDVLSDLGLVDLVDQIPWPVGYHVLVLDWKPTEQKTKGGVFLPDESIEAVRYGTFMGTVVALGSECYQNRRFFRFNPHTTMYEPCRPWCEPGRHVTFHSQVGYAMDVRGHRFRIINDDSALSCPKSLSGLKVHVIEAA